MGNGLVISLTMLHKGNNRACLPCPPVRTAFAKVAWNVAVGVNSILHPVLDRGLHQTQLELKRNIGVK